MNIKTLLILFGIVAVAQLTGCLFVDRDHREHRENYEHQDHHDRDSGIDVHLHGS